MDIYESLQDDHKKIIVLLNQLVETSNSDQEKWKIVLNKIADELIPHSRAEEAVFYNAIREIGLIRGQITHSYAEHAMAETDLRALQVMKVIDVNLTALTRKLRDDVLHHIQQEESSVFQEAKKIFTEEEAKMIGKAFEKLKALVKSQSFVGITIDLISNLLPRRLIPGFRKIYSEKKTAA